MTILIIDVGTTTVRASAVHDGGEVAITHRRPLPPRSPMPGFVEFDPAELATTVLGLAGRVMGECGPISAVGITNQRASTVLWDRATGRPVAPGVGWQDLRTVGMCLALQARGIRLAPSASATKLVFLLDLADPDRRRNLCFGTIDSWVAWALSGGTSHVTDPTNAALTGLLTHDGAGWDPALLDALRIPEAVLPAIVDTSGVAGVAHALDGAPPIAALAGDQQASLVGQG
ncbi:MAG: FGGY family carbohydrate kinase, partial [Acidimicrobiales bacterium]